MSSTTSLRIFFANVLQNNREFDAMFQEIAAAHPDVVVFAEWGWAWSQAFQQSPVSAAYVHGISARQRYFGHVNVFSKLPLQNEMQNWVAGRLVRTANIQLGSHTLRLVALHAPRPVYDSGYDYRGFWNQMIPLLATEPRPLLVIGDFNATEHSLVYQRLKAMGLRSAHEDRGRGYAVTWPNDDEQYGWLPPIRIDQAFLSPEVACQRIVEGRGKGSDHKPLVVDVRIRDGGDRSSPALSGGQ
jgi:endonuclease/exonuclease/phosphatase (EEP) superfamily protein YafD